MTKNKLVELTQKEYSNGVSMLILGDPYQKEIYPNPIVAKSLSSYYFFEIKKDSHKSLPALVEEVAKKEEEKQSKNGRSNLSKRNSFVMYKGRTNQEGSIPAMVKFYEAQLPEGLDKFSW